MAAGVAGVWRSRCEAAAAVWASWHWISVILGGGRADVNHGAQRCLRCAYARNRVPKLIALVLISHCRCPPGSRPRTALGLRALTGLAPN